jgi:hypothetical protein
MDVDPKPKTVKDRFQRGKFSEGVDGFEGVGRSRPEPFGNSDRNGRHRPIEDDATRLR